MPEDAFQISHSIESQLIKANPEVPMEIFLYLGILIVFIAVLIAVSRPKKLKGRFGNVLISALILSGSVLLGGLEVSVGLLFMLIYINFYLKKEGKNEIRKADNPSDVNKPASPVVDSGIPVINPGVPATNPDDRNPTSSQ